MNSTAESLERGRWQGATGLLRREVLRRIARLSGELQILEPGRRVRLGRPEPGGQKPPTLVVHDPAFYRHVALGGGTGAGEAYMAGLWDSDDLVGVLRLLARNRQILERVDGGGARAAAWLLRAWHAMNRNTRRGSARNIAAHYDLGDELFELFLDRDMHYSSAVYDRPSMTLEEAQAAKLDRICRKLSLSADHHLLEIGTGWGGFAIHAAQRFGCRVTTTTISPAQHATASERVEAAGLSDRVTVLLEDYRDLRGQFDRLVSIEMVEAVGHQYLDGFFRRCGELLRPDGAMMLQAITIEDHRYRQALKRVDFIKRFVFPGCFIPCASELLASAARASDLRLLHMEDIGDSYARTLAQWRRRFEDRHDSVRDLGFSESFIRMWRFYLAYCEAGFRERALGDAQMLLCRPGYRGPSLLPPCEVFP